MPTQESVPGLVMRWMMTKRRRHRLIGLSRCGYIKRPKQDSKIEKVSQAAALLLGAITLVQNESIYHAEGIQLLHALRRHLQRSCGC